MFTPVRPPYLLRRYYKDFTWNLPGEGRKVYLTFDDGPVPEVTDFVLDTLSRFEMRATFFCIGNNVKQHPALFNRIRESGHRIAVFRNQSGNFAAGRYNRSKRFSYAKANVSLNEHVEPTGLFRPVVISRVILKHRVHSAIHSLAMTFCPSRF